MLPVVDPHIVFTSTGKPLVSTLDALDTIHLLKAIHVQPAMSSQAAADDVADAEQLATTRGSGGLPNGIIASVDSSNPITPVAGLVDIAQRPRVCGITCHQLTPFASKSETTINRFFDALLMLQIPLDVWPNAEDVSTLVKVADRYTDVPIIVNLSPATITTNELTAVDVIQSLVRFEQVRLKIGAPTASENGEAQATASILPLIELFSASRVMFASFYSTAKHPQEYERGWQTLATITRHLPARDRDQLFRNNAITTYSL